MTAISRITQFANEEPHPAVVRLQVENRRGVLFLQCGDSPPIGLQENDSVVIHVRMSEDGIWLTRAEAIEIRDRERRLRDAFASAASSKEAAQVGLVR